MALSPLPTTSMPEGERKEVSVFPYPKIDKTLQENAQQEAAVLSPFLKTQATEQSSEQQVEHNTEEQRMNELESMLSEAQNHTAVIEQEAYDKAYAAGEKSGLALGEKRAEQIIEAMQTILEQAQGELENLQSQSVAAVVDVSRAVLEHVMGETDGSIQKVLEHSVSRALDQFLLGFNEGLVLAVNPQDLNMFARMTTLPEGCKIKAHQDVPEGSCRLISSGQDILIDPKQTIQDTLQHVRERLSQDD